MVFKVLFLLTNFRPEKEQTSKDFGHFRVTLLSEEVGLPPNFQMLLLSFLFAGNYLIFSEKSEQCDHPKIYDRKGQPKKYRRLGTDSRRDG